MKELETTGWIFYYIGTTQTYCNVYHTEEVDKYFDCIKEDGLDMKAKFNTTAADSYQDC